MGQREREGGEDARDSVGEPEVHIAVRERFAVAGERVVPRGYVPARAPLGGAGARQRDQFGGQVLRGPPYDGAVRSLRGGRGREVGEYAGESGHHVVGVEGDAVTGGCVTRRQIGDLCGQLGVDAGQRAPVAGVVGGEVGERQREARGSACHPRLVDGHVMGGADHGREALMGEVRPVFGRIGNRPARIAESKCAPGLSGQQGNTAPEKWIGGILLAGIQRMPHQFRIGEAAHNEFCEFTGACREGVRDEGLHIDGHGEAVLSRGSGG